MISKNILEKYQKLKYEIGELIQEYGIKELEADEPDEEVKLEKGDRAVFSDILNRLQEGKGIIDTFESISDLDYFENQFKTPSEYYYKYSIKFSDFNPNDMEETKKHILCVKNGKVVKYKG